MSDEECHGDRGEDGGNAVSGNRTPCPPENPEGAQWSWESLEKAADLARQIASRGGGPSPEQDMQLSDSETTDLAEDVERTSIAHSFERLSELEVERAEADNRRRTVLFWVVIPLLIVTFSISVAVILVLLAKDAITDPIGVAFFTSVAAETIGLTAIVAMHLYPKEGHNPKRENFEKK